MSKESRNTYLLKNTLIFTLGNIGSKLIAFFLVPLYTHILSPSQYGTIDLITTISTVAVPILTLNIAEAVMRFGLDKDVDREKITQCGSIILVISAFVGILLIPLCNLVNGLSNYQVYIYFYVISLSASQLYLCDLRGKELFFQYSIGNVLQTFMIAILNILLLIVFRMELKGYLLAYIFANLFVAIYAFIVGDSYKSFSYKGFDFIKLQEMIKYSIVLIPNSFMWWIINSSDRIMVTSMVGISENGIYAVSYKIPTLMSVFTGIFNQAWGYSAIKEEGAEDEEKYNNKILRLLISFTVIVTICLLTITKPFLKIYVSEAYYSAWKYVPFLLIGNVYLTIATFIATSYIVHKDSLGFLISGSLGAIINLILNFVLIPFWGCMGAAIATCISYIMVLVSRVIHTKKYLKYDIWNKEFFGGNILLITNTLIMYMDISFGIYIQIVISLVALVFYSKTLHSIIQILISKLKIRRG